MPARSRTRPSNTSAWTSLPMMIPARRMQRASAQLSESRLLTECRTALSIFLHPELIHASERVGLLPFQSIPTIEVAHQMITAEQAAIMLHEPRRKFKTDEVQIVLGEEGFNLRNRQTMLLDVEQEIAALAGAEKIPGLGNSLKSRVQEVLATAANIVHRAAVALLRDELARGGNVMP